MLYSIFCFDDFIKKYNDKFNQCRYPYYEKRCKEIVKKLFYAQLVTEDEITFLEKHGGISKNEWMRYISEFNDFLEQEEHALMAECFLDPNNMPYA